MVQTTTQMTITVQTTRGEHSFSFSHTTKIDEVIRVVREHFELTGEGAFTLIRAEDQKELVPTTRPLVSFGIEEGDRLVLTGGGKNV